MLPSPYFRNIFMHKAIYGFWNIQACNLRKLYTDLCAYFEVCPTLHSVKADVKWSTSHLSVSLSCYYKWFVLLLSLFDLEIRSLWRTCQQTLIPAIVSSRSNRFTVRLRFISGFTHEQRLSVHLNWASLQLYMGLIKLISYQSCWWITESKRGKVTITD